MKKLLFFLFGMLAFAYACTGISFKTSDGGIIHARSIEYGESDLNSKLVVSPRGKVYTSLLPNTKDVGMKWTSKYGFVGISVIDEKFIAEGINEDGLNAGFFYFPKYGSLKRYNPKNKSKSIIDMQFITYLLSSYKNVDEVRANLSKIDIVNIAYDEKNEPLPTAHYRVADANGKNIVIEIIDGGKINIYDNKVGVLTNSPDYSWHVKNLNNYINLQPGNANGYKVEGEELFSFGVGTGALGLPGDITPPSRFVRAFYYLSTMQTINDFQKGVKSAIHVLNNFDIPIWLEYGKEHQKYIPTNLLSATQWTSVSELTNKHFYYKTMKNEQLRKIDLKKIDFSKINYQVLTLDVEDGIKELSI